jgi:hypothetical protein
VNHWLLTLRVRFGPPLGESSSMFSSGIKDMTKPQDRAARWAPRAALREQFTLKLSQIGVWNHFPLQGSRPGPVICDGRSLRTP